MILLDFVHQGMRILIASPLSRERVLTSRIQPRKPWRRASSGFMRTTTRSSAKTIRHRYAATSPSKTPRIMSINISVMLRQTGSQVLNVMKRQSNTFTRAHVLVRTRTLRTIRALLRSTAARVPG